MRFFVLLLLSISVLTAKDKDTCYTVQLTSFVLPKNSSYNFEAQHYPTSCKLFQFSRVNTVRCGCFERYGEAKKQQKVFEKHYRDTLIVPTYKYRFAPEKSQANIQLNQTLEDVNLSTGESSEEENLTEERSFFDDITFQGHVNLAAQTYLTKPTGKHKNNYTVSTEMEVAYNKNELKGFAKIRAQQDYYDLLGKDEHNDRSYLRLQELYMKYDLEDAQLFFGKNIRFWGALELRNITDVFNLSDFRSDPAENDKIGSWNAAYTHYTEDGEFSAIVKLYEQDRKMPAYPYVYYPFTNHRITYDSQLQTESSPMRPSVYLKYSGTADSEYAFDYSIVFENGYDSQRYYTAPVAPEFKVYEHAYLVNKFISYNTLVVDATLYKLEAVYTDVLYNDLISDYVHLGLGVEHTLTQIYKEADLGLLMEYYRYGRVQNDTYSDLDLFEVFQNDLFIGGRYSFNEGNDASIVGGVMFDLQYDEQLYYLKYEGRINDIIKLSVDYRQSEPSANYETALKRMGEQKRISIKAGYYF